MLKAHTCRYFTGLANGSCEMKVEYSSVERPSGLEDAAPYWQTCHPCISPPDPLPDENEQARLAACSQASYPSAEEEAAEEARIKQKLKEWMNDIKSGICPTHKIQVSKRQVGRCVYAVECGCRLYQGRLKKEARI